MPTPTNLPPESSDSWGPRRSEQLFGGLAATGAGIALLSILNDQIRSQRRKIQADKGKVLEDTLVISPPGYKQATLTQWIAGLGAGAGTYYLIQKAYQEMRRKQLAAEIAAADSQYGGALEESMAPVSPPPKQKRAAEGYGPSVWEMIKGMPADTLWIPALAAGVGTYGLLEHTWPKVSEKAEAGKPRKIVVKGYGTVMADGPGDGPIAQLDKERGSRMVKKEVVADEVAEARPSTSWLGNALGKAASISCTVGVDDQLCAASMMTFLLAEQPALKLAHSGLVSLLGAHAQDGRATEQLVKEAGLMAAIELSKGADDHYYNLTPMQKRAAVHQAFSSPVMRPGILTLAISELAETNPDLSKRAQVVSDDPVYSQMMTKIASLTWQTEIVLADEAGELDKSAAASSMAADMRRQMGTLGISESEDADGQMDDADDAYSDETDPIDQFLAGDKEQKTRKKKRPQ